MATEQFITDFETQMKRLEEINIKIQANIDEKQQFSTRLLTKLREINVSIQTLGGNIRRLADTITDLRGQLGNNEQRNKALQEQIQLLEARLAETERSINELTRERDEARQQIDSARNEIAVAQSSIQVLQKRIEELEEELRRRPLPPGPPGPPGPEPPGPEPPAPPGPDVQALQEEINNLRDQLTAAQETMEQMRQAEEAQRQAAERAQAELLGAEQEIKALQVERESLIKRLQDLDRQNIDLVRRIQSATLAIERAMDSFNLLMDNIQREAPAQNAQVDTILDEIERSIAAVQTAINNVDNGAVIPPPLPLSPAPPLVSSRPPPLPSSPPPVLPSGPPPVPSSPPPAPPARLSDTDVTNIKSNTGVDTQISVGELKAKLNEKNKQLVSRDPNNKFKQAINLLQAPGVTLQDIPGILSRLRIVIKNGILQGGKKKRTKKLKGGYVYNLNTKRRSLSSASSNSRRRTRRSSRRSSKRSSRRSSKYNSTR